MPEHLQEDDDFPKTPPTQPATPATPPNGPSSRSNWPTALGVIGIVLGGLGVLGGLMGVVSNLLFEDSLESLLSGTAPGQEALNAAFEITTQWRGWTIGFALLGMAVAALLLAGGVLLLRRRRASVRALRIWAGAKIVLVVANAVIGIVIQQAIFKVMLRTLPGAAPEAFIGIFGIVSVIFALLWGLALPVFMAIWFARQKIKNEVALWT